MTPGSSTRGRLPARRGGERRSRCSSATVAALVWANAGRRPPLTTNSFWAERAWTLDLRHWVNDGLMALFFFVVGLEIKRELVRRRAARPARGGAAGDRGGRRRRAPGGIFVALTAGGEGARAGPSRRRPTSPSRSASSRCSATACPPALRAVPARRSPSSTTSSRSRSSPSSTAASCRGGWLAARRRLLAASWRCIGSASARSRLRRRSGVACGSRCTSRACTRRSPASRSGC